MDTKKKIREYFEKSDNHPANFFDLLSFAGCRADTLNAHIGRMLDSGELIEIAENVGYLKLNPDFVRET